MLWIKKDKTPDLSRSNVVYETTWPGCGHLRWRRNDQVLGYEITFIYLGLVGFLSSVKTFNSIKTILKKHDSLKLFDAGRAVT